MLKKQGTDLFRARKADVGRGMKFSSECAVPWAQLTIFGAIYGTCTALKHRVNPQYSQHWGPGQADPHSTKFKEAKFFHYDISFWVLIRAQNPNWGLSGTPNVGTRPLLSLILLIGTEMTLWPDGDIKLSFLRLKLWMILIQSQLFQEQITWLNHQNEKL